MNKDTVVYQLIEPYGERLGGPVMGPPGLNLTAYVAQYRAEKYAQAEAKQDDFCFLSGDDFLEWLIVKSVVQPLPHQSLTVTVESTGDHAYVPKHWPECPQCHRGRGEEQMGRVLHDLNRAEWFHKCTECGHAWGHVDQPYLSNRPMLEDDGRYIQGGCVPYSISQVGGIPIEKVLEVCREWGWREQHGMDSSAGLKAARSFGLLFERYHAARDVEGKATLRRVLATLSARKNYIIATDGHWLPVVCGENRDPAETHLRCVVLDCWEVGTGK